jgi:hypothetical protein
VRISICFYQHESGRSALERLKREIGAGYIRSRAGNMADYTIVEREAVKSTLQLIKPYVRLKKRHVELAELILEKAESAPSPSEFLALARLVDEFSALNYSKKKLNDAEAVRNYLNSKGLLAPVTTDPLTER